MRMLLPWARREEQRQDIPVLSQEDICEPKCLSKATETCREDLSRVNLHGDNMREVIMARCSWASGGGHQSLSEASHPLPHPGDRSQTLEAKLPPEPEATQCTDPNTPSSLLPQSLRGTFLPLSAPRQLGPLTSGLLHTSCVKIRFPRSQEHSYQPLGPPTKPQAKDTDTL